MINSAFSIKSQQELITKVPSHQIKIEKVVKLTYFHPPALDFLFRALNIREYFQVGQEQHASEWSRKKGQALKFYGDTFLQYLFIVVSTLIELCDSSLMQIAQLSLFNSSIIRELF